MSNNETSSEPMAIYQLNRQDFGPVFIDGLKLKPSIFSPFVDDFATYTPGSTQLSEGAKEALKDDDFINMLKIVGNPDYRLEILIGGGMVPLNGIRVYASKNIDNNLMVMVTPGFEEAHLLQLFASPANVGKWLTEILAVNIDEHPQNFLPPPLSLGSFIYALYAIDAFRRISYQNLLNFTTTSDPYILTSEFQASMLTSMNSLDIRWLLPSFIALLPGFSELNWDIADGDLDYLGAHNLLIPAKEQGSGKDIFLFGEAGTTLGAEFFRNWFSSAGYRITAVTSGKELVLEQGYLAFTALANHFFRLLSRENNAININHQALTTVDFEKRLLDLLHKTLKQEREASTASAVGVSRTADSQKVLADKPVNFCTNCGAKLTDNARFCVACGNKIG